MEQPTASASASGSAASPAELVPRMAASRRQGHRGPYDAQLSHLAVGFDVRDVLSLVGSPSPHPHEQPLITLSLCDLPYDAQRSAFAELVRWPGAKVNLHGGMRADRATLRFEDRPQLVVSFLLGAIGTQVEGEPERRFVWAVRPELMPS